MATKNTGKPASKPSKKPEPPATTSMDMQKALGAAEVAKKFRLINDLEATFTAENMGKFVRREARHGATAHAIRPVRSQTGTDNRADERC